MKSQKVTPPVANLNLSLDPSATQFPAIDNPSLLSVGRSQNSNTSSSSPQPDHISDVPQFSRSLFNGLSNWFWEQSQRFGPQLLMLAALMLPIRLSFALFPFSLAIVLWIFSGRLTLSRLRASSGILMLLGFVCFMAINSAFGIDPFGSVRRIGTIFFYTFGAYVVVDLLNQTKLMQLGLALCIGQALAALHSVLSRVLPDLPQAFIGEVTESGQIGMTLFFALGLLVTHLRLLPEQIGGSSNCSRQNFFRTRAMSGILMFLLFSVSAFSAGSVAEIGSIRIILASLILGGVLLALRSAIGESRQCQAGLSSVTLLVVVILPLMAAALLVNLKRGPWIGVSVGLIVFLWQFRRNLVPLIVVVLGLIAITVSPVRERIADSYEHFFISGGRSVIWHIGSDLILRYPLGIGFRNSPILQKFSDEIPAQLRHFHNNLINITVEGGWLGAAIFLWLLVVVVRTAFHRKKADPFAPLAYALGCAIISWQVAGLVEYNFGDSEIFIIAAMTIGSIFLLDKLAKPSDETLRVHQQN